MSHVDENEALNDDQLSDEGLDEGELLKDSGEDKNMARTFRCSLPTLRFFHWQYLTCQKDSINWRKSLPRRVKALANDRARNIKMPFPPKNARAPRASKIPRTTTMFKHSWLKLPAMTTISEPGTKMKQLQNYRKSTSLKTLSGKTICQAPWQNVSESPARQSP